MNVNNNVLSSVEECERQLAKLLGRDCCVWTGNGTSALYLAYKLCPDQRPKILLPALMCVQPMLAVYYAGRIPVFCDVREEDATIDPNAVDEMLKNDRDIGAVLAVHLYGNAADVERLKAICKKHDVFLIEDLAQALGGRYTDGSSFGSKGDFSVVSFGYSKILDAGDGGGFITDDASIARRARDWERRIPEQTKNSQILQDDFKKLYYMVTELGQKDPKFFQMFDQFPDLFQSLFLYQRIDGAAAHTLSLLDTLEGEVARRIKMQDLYLRELQGISSVQFFCAQSGVPWRFTFRVDANRRDELLQYVRSIGFDISSWYPSITEWTPTGRLQGREQFPIANKLEQEVVNLWVDPSYDEAKVQLLTKQIKEFLLTGRVIEP